MVLVSIVEVDLRSSVEGGGTIPLVEDQFGIGIGLNNIGVSIGVEAKEEGVAIVNTNFQGDVAVGNVLGHGRIGAALVRDLDNIAVNV